MVGGRMKRIHALGIILLFIGMSISSSTGFNLEKKSTISLDRKTLYVGGRGPGYYTKMEDAIDDASDGQKGIFLNSHIAYSLGYKNCSGLFQFELPEFNNFSCLCPNISTSYYGITWCHRNKNIYATDAIGMISILNPETCETILLGSSGIGVLVDLSYDPYSDALYGINASSFYEISMETGSATLIGSLGISSLMVGMDCDRRGNMYGVDLGFGSSTFYSINISTGYATKIGNSGVQLNYGSIIAFDKDYDLLYAIFFNYATFRPELHIINVTTGETTYVGPPPPGVGEFTIPYYFWNQSPDKPSIEGETNGKIKTEYKYNFLSSDPEGLPIWYFIDWRDGTNTGWIGPYPSGKEINKSHNWLEKGEFTIRCKCKDLYGNESEWGELRVTMPKNQNVFLSHWLHRFPILNQLITRIMERWSI
jgi:hypothetical protein